MNSALTQSAIYVVRPTISYRTLELGGSLFQLGMIGAAYALLPVLVAIPFGRFASRFGEGKFLVLGTVGITFCGVYLGIAHSLMMIAILSAMAGMSHLVCMIGGQSMVAIKSSHVEYAKNFGYYTFSASLGQTIGPAVAGIVLSKTLFSLNGTQLTLILGGLVALFGLFPTLKLLSIKSTAPSASEKLKLTSALKTPAIRRAVVVSAIVSSGIDILVIYLPALGVDRGYAPGIVGAILSIRAVTSMLARLSLGKLSKRFSNREILTGSLAVSGISCFAIYLTTTSIQLGAAVLILGLGSGVAQPLTMALVSEEVATDEKTQMIAIRLLGNRTGQLIFPILASACIAATSIEVMFVVLGATLIAPLIKHAV